MNKEDREQFDDLKADVRFVKNTLTLALENHLAHIEQYTEENRDMIEQSWALAEAAEKAAAETKKFVRWALPLSIGFIGLVVAIVTCLA